MLEKFNGYYNKELKFEPAVIEALSDYDWPCNFEELKMVVARLVLTVKGPLVKTTDLPLPILLKTGAAAGADFSANFEKEYIREVLASTANQTAPAAALLGISQNVLATKI